MSTYSIDIMSVCLSVRIQKIMKIYIYEIQEIKFSQILYLIPFLICFFMITEHLPVFPIMIFIYYIILFFSNSFTTNFVVILVLVLNIFNIKMVESYLLLFFKSWQSDRFFLSVYYYNKRLHVSFGFFRAVLKFTAGSLKTAKIQVWNRKLVKEWSNSHDLTVHGSSLLLRIRQKIILSIQL